MQKILIDLLVYRLYYYYYLMKNKDSLIFYLFSYKLIVKLVFFNQNVFRLLKALD